MRSILKVTTPAPSVDLITLATLKSELNITNNASDTRLGEIISQASGTVAEITGRVWVQEAIEEKFIFGFWERVPTLVLKRRPISVVSLITENGNALTEDVDFIVDAEKGMVHRAGFLHFVSGIPGSPSVVVDYIGGYDLAGSPPDTLPYGLVRATLILAKAYWFGGARDPNIKSETTYGLDSIGYRDIADAEKEVMDLLSIYSDPTMA